VCRANSIIFKQKSATKNALIMPFIQALGYDVFNPSEVVPEFTADVGTKKGEKVDYAVLRDGKPIMLFECKKADATLNDDHSSQLYRYFSMTDARFGVLTNGIDYRIYSDLEEPNKMDSRPFLEFSILTVSDATAAELKKFTKDAFDVDNILATASDLKYTKGIKRALAEEWVNPSEKFVRTMAARVYSGRLSSVVLRQFGQITKQAFQQFVNDRVNERLKSALKGEQSAEATAEPDQKIDTTEEEIDGFYVVKSLVREVLDVDRVFMRDHANYCSVLADNNNRKTICRMWFNGHHNKYLSTFDAQKKETKHLITSVNGIYAFADELKKIAMHYAAAPRSDHQLEHSL
jgi:hypothetical protein